MIVSRVAERARLDALLTALVRGEGGALVVHGEAGIGKTTLLEALVGDGASGSGIGAGEVLRVSPGGQSTLTTNTAPMGTPNLDDPTDMGFLPNGDIVVTDESFTAGMWVKHDGTIADVVYGAPAYGAGLTPGMKITSVNGRKFSGDALREEIVAKRALDLNIEQGTFAGAGGMGVRCDRDDLTFFPDIYNDDWFFFSGGAHLFSKCDLVLISD